MAPRLRYNYPVLGDGLTLRGRFLTNLAVRERKCEPDAIRLCNIAFGRGRGPSDVAERPHVWGRHFPRRGTP